MMKNWKVRNELKRKKQMHALAKRARKGKLDIEAQQTKHVERAVSYGKASKTALTGGAITAVLINRPLGLLLMAGSGALKGLKHQQINQARLLEEARKKNLRR